MLSLKLHDVSVALIAERGSGLTRATRVVLMEVSCEDQSCMINRTCKGCHGGRKLVHRRVADPQRK